MESGSDGEVCARIGSFAWKHNVCPEPRRVRCLPACVQMRTQADGFIVTAYLARDSVRRVWAFARDPRGDARVWGVWANDDLARKYRGGLPYTVDNNRTFAELADAKDYLRECIDAVFAGVASERLRTGV